MGRFINLGIAIVNTSYIIRVEMESDGRAEIYMSEGNVRDILDEACRATRADMTTAEKNQFYDKYIKTMHVDISPNGEATIVLGK